MHAQNKHLRQHTHRNVWSLESWYVVPFISMGPPTIAPYAVNLHRCFSVSCFVAGTHACEPTFAQNGADYCIYEVNTDRGRLMAFIPVGLWRCKEVIPHLITCHLSWFVVEPGVPCILRTYPTFSPNEARMIGTRSAERQQSLHNSVCSWPRDIQTF